MNYNFDVSDIVAVAINRHNSAFSDFIDRVKREIQFATYDAEAGIPCPPGVTPDQYEPSYSPDGKLEKVIISRKTGKYFSRLEIVADPRWRGTFSFKCIYNDQIPQYKHEVMDPVNFFTQFRPNLIRFFEKDEL